MATSRTPASAPAGSDGAAAVERFEALLDSGRVVTGRAKLGKKTKHLVPRLRPGDIAVIDHRGVDRIAAEDLVESGIELVVNVAPSMSEHYPNPGPLILVRGGVQLIDAVGSNLFDQLADGERITVRGGRILRSDGTLVARGRELRLEDLLVDVRMQQERVSEAIEHFAENTLEHIREERELLAGRLSLPDFDTGFRGRQVLVVVRGTDYKRDLRTLRPYISEMHPLLVAVDGGADALLAAGLRPDMIVGDMDSASDDVLRCGAELVVHAYRDGRAPGRERLHRLGLEHKVLPAPGTSQDVAMLIAFERGAELIVSVGSHFNLVEFLDKARAGMSSTFLTRLRVGEILVDAKGVSRLYRPAPKRRLVAAVVAAFALTMAIVVLSSPELRRLIDLLWLKIQVLLGGG